MSDIRQARALLRIAYKDFDAIVGMARDTTAFADEIFGFHVQQAIEKAMKAWICVRNIMYPLTHQLARLMTVLANTEVDMEAYWRLDRYSASAVQARYDGGVVELEEPLNRATAIAEVRALLDYVTQLVEKSEDGGDPM